MADRGMHQCRSAGPPGSSPSYAWRWSGCSFCSSSSSRSKSLMILSSLGTHHTRWSNLTYHARVILDFPPPEKGALLIFILPCACVGMALMALSILKTGWQIGNILERVPSQAINDGNDVATQQQQLWVVGRPSPGRTSIFQIDNWAVTSSLYA